MKQWFEELQRKRRGWVDSSRENNFEAGIRMSMADKYTEDTHFVYELLQNAEDQNATEVSFRMDRARLVFEHNGEAFTRSDVDAITGIGNSKKSEQPNKIGRFGVGFKSVFQITERPEIHSTLEEQPFSFAIEDMVIPVEIPTTVDAGKTIFLFPFTREKASALYETIERRLDSLGADTLLFLRHLRAIHWETETHRGTYLCEQTSAAPARYHLIGEAGAKGETPKTDERTYLRLDRYLRREENRDLSVSIAYRLEGDRVAPDPAPLNVFFPTEQRTGLHFRVHAPMLLTDNRANIKANEPENERLIQQCAELVAESLPVLRDLGYLTVDTLNSLPINQEGIEKPLLPVFNAVRDAFLAQELLPTGRTDAPRHVASQHAYMARTVALRELLDERQLASLKRSPEPLYWLSAEITEDKTPRLRRYLLDTLRVREETPEIVASSMSEEFFSPQSDTWMARFYKYLKTTPALWQKGGALRQKPFIRCQDAKQEVCHYAPFDAHGAPVVFLPTDYPTNYTIVKRSLWDDPECQDFFKNLGLEDPDIVDEVIRFILPKYGSDTAPPDDVYNADLDRIADAIDKNGNRLDLLAAHLATTRFLQTAPLTEQHQTIMLSPAPPDNVEKGIRRLTSEIESGYINDELRKICTLARRRLQLASVVYAPTEEVIAWFGGNEDVSVLTDKVWSHRRFAGIRDFLERNNHTLHTAIRVKHRAIGSDGFVVIQAEHSKHERGLKGFDRMADIHGLAYALENITLERAQILWRLLLRHSNLIYGTVQSATNANYKNCQTENVWSTIGEMCRDTAWLPKRDGTFHKPAEMYLDDLPDGFDTESVGAREVEGHLKLRKAQNSDIRNLAKGYGLPPEHDQDIEEILSFIRVNPDAIPALKQHMDTYERSFPEHAPVNPDRRADKVEQGALEADEKVYAERTRSVRVSGADTRDMAKRYLSNLYTNEAREMICQGCHHGMPFRLPTGDPYFEAVQCLRQLTKEHYQNYLALCPVCAAKFQHANPCRKDPGQIAELIANATPEDPYMRLPLAEKDHEIRFVETHLRDLQTVLKASSSET